ncbi:SGNH/GDSL hydrolase family protein [Aquihabitans sp. G128]|uniref:SGNH/GDSL hydrolase family protein n=1 Tax=Aquihabitans sp. G128 TaxID=2849779 RepID=UPI001C23040F|nr:SGNH/GDSL hydrolase family protein [Aquihabitans sp. G128]QXC59634.1 SGNH/GDSL hydrolase family protein [Aquihabitans sp. G128]
MAALALLALASLSGCSSDGGSDASVAAPDDGTYVSIGDSYAQGYQPTVGGTTPDYRKGYAYLLPALAKPKGYALKTVNFGCGGATVGSLTEQDGCKAGARSPGGPTYDDDQLDAALGYLEDHPGQVQVVTISIGGNDVTGCAQASDAITCVTGAVKDIEAGLRTILPKVRKAAGPDAVIVGLTYPDVILGGYLASDGAGKQLAELSVVAFRQFINPMLKEAYESVDGVFVDVTEATGAYTPLTETTDLAPYGTIPKAVAEVCRLTWFCEVQDIHPRDAGYAEIARLIAAALPDRG